MGPHPLALRERVVDAVEQGATIVEAAQRFKVGEASVKRWLRRQREHGTLEPGVSSGRPPLLDEHAPWLAELRAAEPSLSCQAVVDRLAQEKGLRVHETTLWYWLRRHGISHKKRRFKPRSANART